MVKIRRTQCFFASFLFLGWMSSAAQGVMIETVPVGNPGNVPDSTGFGAVEYVYRIGKYEVTNAQYVEFLNINDPQGDNALGLYNPEMSLQPLGGIEFDSSGPQGMKYAAKSGRAQKPVDYVSWFDAARFTNWLHNGQRPGETESGAYELLGGTPIPFNRTVTRSANARWFLPSEDEWYKAAHYDNNGLNGNYWKYPTQSNSLPLNGTPPGDSNSANYNQPFDGTDHFDVGSYGSAPSAIGTFDQAGNVSEWTDKLFGGACRIGPCERVRRGGSRTAVDVSSSVRPTIDPIAEIDFIGFRVATNVPEPHAVTLVAVGIAAVPIRRRRPWNAG